MTTKAKTKKATRTGLARRIVSRKKVRLNTASRNSEWIPFVIRPVLLLADHLRTLPCRDGVQVTIGPGEIVADKREEFWLRCEQTASMTRPLSLSEAGLWRVSVALERLCRGLEYRGSTCYVQKHLVDVLAAALEETSGYLRRRGALEPDTQRYQFAFWATEVNPKRRLKKLRQHIDEVSQFPMKLRQLEMLKSYRDMLHDQYDRLSRAIEIVNCPAEA